MKYKLISFDLDGTLVNTLPSLAYVGNLWLQGLGIKPVDPADYAFLVGRGSKNHVIDLLKYVDYPPYDAEFLQLQWQRYIELLKNNGTYKVQPYPGLVEFLESLKKADVSYIVYTNKKETVAARVLQAAYAGTGIEFPVIYGDKPGNIIKPDVTRLLAYMKEHSLSPAEVMHVGDTNVDMQTAHNAKVTATGVLWGFRDKAELQAAGADYLVQTPAELQRLILQNI